VFVADLEDAIRLGEKALSRMRVEGIAPTPENYCVWYHYHSGNIPDLVRAIDILASNQQPFTEERCAELYRRFFGNEAEGAAVRDAGAVLEGALAAVMAALRESDGDVGRYGSALDSFGRQLNLSRSLDQLREALRTVATETTRMAESNRRLQTQLNDSAAQIEDMRNHLEKVRRESVTDALTGIANRKQFDQALRQAAAQSMETDQPLTLLLLDIDHFKQFNDSHGHVAGDQVLKLVARTLSESVGRRDTPARYGGEEFGIIMPGTDMRNAMQTAEKIRSVISSRKIVKRTTSESLGIITLSVGVARFQPGESLVKLVQRADAALYAAKRAGRNRVLPDPDDLARCTAC